MSPRREVHTRAFVLYRRAAGEGSARVSMYTEQLGLITPLATSGREERSKLRAHLVSGTRGTYSLVKGKGEWRITGVVGARTSYYECLLPEAQQAAARVVGLVGQFVHGEGADAALFEAVWDFLTVVPTLTPQDVTIAEYVAVLRILAALGYVAKSDETEVLFGPTYSAALLAHAAEKRSVLVKAINTGLGASGLD